MYRSLFSIYTAVHFFSVKKHCIWVCQVSVHIFAGRKQNERQCIDYLENLSWILSIRIDKVYITIQNLTLRLILTFSNPVYT